MTNSQSVREAEDLAAHIQWMVEELSHTSIGKDILRAIWDTPHTPDADLPPFADPGEPRRKMLVQIEVSADFEKRLDNQWEVEREIKADRWSWQWADEVPQ